jgi:hypothetical protein
MFSPVFSFKVALWHEGRRAVHINHSMERDLCSAKVAFQHKNMSLHLRTCFASLRGIPCEMFLLCTDFTASLKEHCKNHA